MESMTPSERMGYVRAAIGNASALMYSDIQTDAEIIDAGASTSYIAVAAIDFLSTWGGKVRGCFPWMYMTDAEIIDAWGREIDEIRAEKC